MQSFLVEAEGYRSERLHIMETADASVNKGRVMEAADATEQDAQQLEKAGGYREFLWFTYPIWSIFLCSGLYAGTNAVCFKLWGVTFYSLQPDLPVRLWLSSFLFVFIVLATRSVWFRKNWILLPIIWFFVFALFMISGSYTQGALAHWLNVCAGDIRK